MPDKETKLRRVRPTWEKLLPLASDKAAFEDASASLEAGRVVRSLRVKSGLTQSQLAVRLDVSQARISMIENGDGRDGPSYALLKRIVVACGAAWPFEGSTGSPVHRPVTDEIIVAVYDTAAQAEAVVHDLEFIVPSSAITHHSASTMTTQPDKLVREKGFWASLFGSDAGYDEGGYDRSIPEGSSVVAVTVSDHLVQSVADVLERHSPIDIDERVPSYQTGGTATTTTTTTVMPATSLTARATPAATATGSEDVLALSEEHLTVSKRLVNRGTTRIRRFVVETPVEEAVTLRSETVSIQRRPVKARTEATEVGFTDRTVEVTDTSEEAVVAKTVRVREEVVINKAAADRVEIVRDTVRREDVEITRDGQSTARPSATRPAV